MDDECGDERMGSGREVRHCDDCDSLVEALRNSEERCREFEDEWFPLVPRSRGGASGELLRGGDAHWAKLRELEHSRDGALDALLEHQRLEHSGS